MADGDAGGIAPGSSGIVVAVVGSDGSGKSTLCAGLRDDLMATGADVRFVYFGSGDGASSWIRWPLVQIRRLFGPRLERTAANRAKSRPPTPHAMHPTPSADDGERAAVSEGIIDVDAGDSDADDGRPALLRGARAIWALALSWEKRSKLRRARRARDAGAIVVSDRWPQSQVYGRMDGPLLHRWASRPRGVRRTLGRWEAAPYVDATERPADLVLRLVVDQAHAERRRPDHDPADLARRRRIVTSLRFDETRCRVVELDATQDAATVRVDAMAAVLAARRD